MSGTATDIVADDDPNDGKRTQVARLREKQSTDRAALDALLDSTRVGHFGLVRDGRPLVVPSAVGRDGDRVLRADIAVPPSVRRLASADARTVTG